MKNLAILLTLFLFLGCSDDSEDRIEEPQVVQPSATEIGIDIEELSGINYDNVFALSTSEEKAINEHGIFDNPYTPNGIEDLPVLVFEDEQLLFGYYPHTLISNKVDIDDILLFYFLMYPQIAIQGADEVLLLDQIKSSSDYNLMKELVLSNLNSNNSPLYDNAFVLLIRDFSSTVSSSTYTNREPLGEFQFNYDRVGQVEWTEEVALFSAMGFIIKNTNTGEVVFGPELLKTKNLEISTSSISSWVLQEFGTPIPPYLDSFNLLEPGEYEILLTNGHSSNVELDLAINARNYSQFASTAVGLILTAGLKTIAGTDQCRDAIADLHAQQITYVTSLVINNQQPTAQDLVVHLGATGTQFFNSVDACLTGNALIKFIKFIGAVTLGVFNDALDIAELVFLMRDYFGSEIVVNETRYFENGVSFGELSAEQVSTTNFFEGNQGDSFDFAISVSEKTLKYDIERTTFSEFIANPTFPQAEGLPFNVELIQGDATVPANSVFSGESNLAGNLVIPVTLGCLQSEIKVGSALSNNEIEDFIINTNTESQIQLSGELAFGEVQIGSSSEPKVLTINNPSCTPVIISSISVPDGYSSSFTSGTLQPSETIDVNIIFSPEAIQDYSGIITVNNDTDQDNNTIAVSGNGISELLINQLKIIDTSQILDFNGLPFYYHSDYLSYCLSYDIVYSYNYNETSGPNFMDFYFGLPTGNLVDGTYTIVDGLCNYVDNLFFHSDIFDNQELGFITNGSVIVSEDATEFEISGELIKIDDNGNDIPMGPINGRFVFE